MALEKRLLASPAIPSAARCVLKLYRWWSFGTFLWHHDKRLLEFMRTNEPAIFATWHQDFAYTLGYLGRWNNRRRTYALASASRDGGIASAAAESMGFQRPIRGSTARGARRALLEMTRRLQDDRHASMAVVCDGPRPPAREMKAGILHLARATGRPIWLVRTSFSRRHVLERSWARFHWPKLFAHGVVRADGPIHLPRDLDREGVEHWRQQLETRLNALADRADARADQYRRLRASESGS
ncbi:MAG: DUF374 domain-containing protein [Planctomycetota bacterium]|nr:DUF374 domain-containing protein [Planctomycetota bacterium]